jgi:hypothetical protein
MHKVFKLLEWLDSVQAVDYLKELTQGPVTAEHLRQLCAADNCPAYVDCSSATGLDIQGTANHIIGTGIQRLLKPERIGIDEETGFLATAKPQVCGPVLVSVSQHDKKPMHRESEK